MSVGGKNWRNLETFDVDQGKETTAKLLYWIQVCFLRCDL